MESRSAYGTTIDLPAGQAKPSLEALAHVAQRSGEFAVSLQDGRWYSLHMYRLWRHQGKQQLLHSAPSLGFIISDD